LYVPRHAIKPEHFKPFEYSLVDGYTKEAYRTQTYEEFENFYGFPRGDFGKLERVFGRDFVFEDRRAAAPLGYKLRFTGKLSPEQEQVLRKYIETGYGMLQAPPRWGKCVVGDSLIATSSGFIRIEDPLMQRQMQVESLVGMSDTSHYHARAVDCVATVATYCGFTLAGTPEHPILTLDRNLRYAWTPLSEIKPGEHCVAVKRGSSVFAKDYCRIVFKADASYEPRTKTYTVPAVVNEDLGRLLGYLISEGRHDVGLSSFRIANTDQGIIDDAQACAEAVFGTPFAESVDARNGVITLSKGSRQLSELLTYLGVGDETSAHKDVPWCVLQSPKNVVAAFLRAYFDGDGWVEKSKVCVCTASGQMSRTLQILLASFGIVAKRSCHLHKLPSGEKRPYYKICITGENIDLFHSEIGFGVRFKSRLTGLRRFGKRSTTIPFVADALRGFVQKHNIGGWYVCIDGLKRQLSLGPSVASGKYAGITASYLVEYVIPAVGMVDSELAARLAWLAAHADVFWDAAASVACVDGPCNVFDLTVPDQHAFVANGVVVHNTVWMTALMCKLRQRTLMIAHLEDLCSQLEETVRKFTNINELEEQHGRKLCGILKEWDDFFPILTLSTYQCFAVSPKGQRVLKEKKDAFGLVLIDECHRCKTDLYTEVITRLNPAYRCGVTATPERKDNMHVIINDVLGPVTVQAHGEQLHVQYSWEYTGVEVEDFSNWSVMWNRLVKRKTRTKKIAEKVVEDVRAGHFVLVTTERYSHIDDLREAIQKIDFEITIGELSGRIPDREGFRGKAKRGDFQVVLAMSRIVELGYNVPRWSSFHNTLPMTNPQNWYQRISRIRTPMEPAFEGDTYVKPIPVARIWVDAGHKAIWAYKAVVKKENDQRGFECLNPDKPNKKMRRVGAVTFVEVEDEKRDEREDVSGGSVRPAVRPTDIDADDL
jgi:superfamily II DNA or RNA helicase